jgi:hypothetical protein
MSSIEILGLAIFLVGTVVFYVWVAILTLRK